MAQAEHIDLRTGPDRVYRWVAIALWLLSLGTFLLAIPSLHWSLIFACLAVLVLFWPVDKSMLQTSTMRLHFNGAAELGALQGTWAPSSRVSQWATLVRVDVRGQARRVLVCAARNHGQDYRRLLVWSRFPPLGSKGHGIDPQQEAGNP